MVELNIETLGFIGHKGRVRDIDKLKNVLIFILSNLDDAKYKTELIKLSFILDYKFCKKFGSKEGPTTVEYIKYNYGPYSESFIEALEQLKNEGKIFEVGLPFGAGYVIGPRQELDFDENTLIILKEVISEFGKLSLKQFKDFIYCKEEFVKTDFGKTILFN